MLTVYKLAFVNGKAKVAVEKKQTTGNFNQLSAYYRKLLGPWYRGVMCKEYWR